MDPFTLFRGQAIGVKVGRQGDLLQLTLDIEDYNRLWDKAPVGAPDGSYFRTEEDADLLVPFDPLATNTGATDAEVFTYLISVYWPGPTLEVTNFVKVYRQNENEGTIDWGTALTDLRSILDDWAARTSGALRYWADPDLNAHWWALAPTEYAYEGYDPTQLSAMGFPIMDPSDIVAAPYGLDNDVPNWTTDILPMSLELSWDWAPIVYAVYVKGGTVAPEGSGWVGNYPGPGLYGGAAYVESPGSVLMADRQAIGIWHLTQNFRERLTGSATVPAGYNGWRVGQSVEVTDAVVSGFSGHTLDHQALVIQRVTGRLVSPGAGLHLSIDGTDISEYVADWSSFTFEESLGEAGKANAVLDIVPPEGFAAAFTIGQLADIRVWTTGAEIEYDLEFGDIPAGPLPRERALEPGPQPANRFIVTIQDEHVPVGYDTLVTAQLSDAAGAPLMVANVYLEWILLQWGYAGGGDVQFWLDAVHRMEQLVAVYQAIIDGGGTLTAAQQAAMDLDEATLTHDQAMLDAALAGAGTEVAFWTAAVQKMQGYVDAYQAVIDGGGTLTAAQAAAFATDQATLAYDEEQLAAAIAAVGDGPITAGTGYSLADVSGVTDATGRAFTRLSHDSVGTTVELEVDAVALPIS